MKRAFQLIKKRWHWLFLALVIVVTVCMDGYVAGHILDGDASWPFVKGWVIAQQRNVLTNDLYFTTEISFFDTASVAAFFFLFISDWTLVRILTTVVMQAFYVVSFFYLCRQAGVKRKEAILAAGALLVPFSTPYARIVLYHLYYIAHMANAFWLLGLTLRLVHMRQERWREAVCPAVLLAGLWIFVGINGIRHMMIVGLPLLFFTGVQLMLTLGKYHWTDGRLTGPAPLWQESSVRLTFVMFGSCVCFLVGFFINTYLILPAYDVANASATYFRPVAGADRYSQIFNGWLTATGIRHSGMTLVGVRGLGLIAALVAFGYLLAVSVISTFKKGAVENGFMRGMFGAAFITTTLIFVFESLDRTFELYYMPVVAFAASVFAQELGKLKERSVSVGRKLLILFACACYLFQGVYTLYFIRADQQALDTWSGLGYQQMNAVDQVDDCVDFLQENHYSHALINYWYANTMIELSDGSLSVAGFEDEYEYTKTFPLYRWGMPKSAFASENLPEKVVVFIRQEETERFEAIFPDALPVYSGNDFFGYEVDASLIV